LANRPIWAIYDKHSEIGEITGKLGEIFICSGMREMNAA
jgi:hypothetical protein